MNVYALAGILLTADPSKNLFSETWTEGNLYQINGLVEKLGGFACTVISIVGFGIVIFSILKNALSGLYVVNPNFWDKVDEVKMGALKGINGEISNFGQKSGNVGVQKIGSAMSFILQYLPNVKSFTDFDDEDGVPDKKQYFMKSIPLLIAQIFIGMLIFFGFPAKIANWIGTGATHALTAVLNNYDPVTIVTGISDSFIQYQLSTDGSTDPWEKNINEMASQAVSIMHTRYSDMDKEVVQEYAYNIESHLLDRMNINDVQEVLGATQGYVYSTNVIINGTNPGFSQAYKEIGNNVRKATATNGTVSFKYICPVSTLVTDAKSTTVDFTNDFFVWTINATPVAVTNVSTSNFIICGGTSAITGGSYNKTANTYSMKISGPTWGKDYGRLSGSLGTTVNVTVYDSSNASLYSTTASIQSQTVNANEGDGLYLVFNGNEKAALTGLSTADYFEITMSGKWQTSAKNSAGVDTVLSINGMRLKINSSVTSPTFLSTNWDIAGKTVGHDINTVLDATAAP